MRKEIVSFIILFFISFFISAQQIRKSPNTAVARIQSLSGQITNIDAQHFPGSIFTRLYVTDGGSPLLTLDQSNITVREYIAYSSGAIDTLDILKDGNFVIYAPQGNIYTIRYTPASPVFDGLSRGVEVRIDHNGQILKLVGSYTPAETPVIIRTNATLALHNRTLLIGIPVTIEIETLDWDATHTNSAAVYYRTVGSTGPYKQLPMIRTQLVSGLPVRSTWRANIPAPDVVTPGIEYYITASDGQYNATIPEFIDRPGYPFSLTVLPVLPPQVNHTPITQAAPASPIIFTAEVINNDAVISNVYLYYKKEIENDYTVVEMVRQAGTYNYQYVLPALNTYTLLNYYIVAINNYGLTTANGSATVPHPIIMGNPWQVTPGLIVHSIRFLLSSQYNATVTVNNEPIAVGDIIGVFYTDNNGNLKPGGSVSWNGGNLLLMAYGDNPSTPEKDGFATGEIFTFKVLRSQEVKIYNAEHTIHQIAISSPTFQSGRQTYIKSLKAFAEHTIELKQGINLWSTYVSPTNAAFADILTPIASAVQKVEDSYGNVYTNAGPNTLTTYVPGYGYRIVMTSPATLKVKGPKIQPAVTTVNLNDQGVIIGSPYPAKQNVEEVFGQDPNIYFIDKYIIDYVGNITIETYAPNFGYNSWTEKNMEPGKAYYAYALSNYNFTFPPATGPYATFAATERAASVHTAQPITSIDNYMHVLISTDAWNTAIEKEDEVRVYSKKGTLLGKSLVGNNGTIITLDGTLVQGHEEFYLSRWSHTSRSEEPLAVAEWRSGDNKYRNHSAAFINKFQQQTPGKSLEMETLRVFPNPVIDQSEINFSLTDDNEVSIELYDTQGIRIMQTIASQAYKKGEHKVLFSKQGLPSGLYVIKVTSKNKIGTKRIMIK